MHIAGIAASSRTSLFIAPWGKLWFFFTRPLSSAFHFTYLFNEKDVAGYIIYFLLFGTWLVLAFLCLKGTALQHRLKYIAMVLILLVLSYMPSLLVRENYASNRTLLALDTCVWFITAEMVLYYLKSKNENRLFRILIAFLFSINAFYNITRLFLRPINYEYVQLRRYVEQHVTPAVHTIYFIRPQEDFFVKKYGITRSWDEFGVPSTFFSWVPEFFIRQIVYEKTGDRNLAKKIIIKDNPTKQALDSLVQTNHATVLLVQAEALIKSGK